MSGCNSNQNGYVQGRSTSRVLQPPGGASSFSIGGYGGTDSGSGGGGGGYGRSGSFRSSQSNGYQSSQQYPPQQANSRSQRIPADKPPQGRSQRDSFGNDCEIPGLQSHYAGKSGKPLTSQENALYAAASSRNGPQSGPLSGQDYAAQLKAQIDAKASMSKSGRGGSGDGYSRGTSTAYGQDDEDGRYPARRASPQLVAAGNSSQSNGYRVNNPPGGASTFSLF